MIPSNLCNFIKNSVKKKKKSDTKEPAKKMLVYCGRARQEDRMLP